MLEPKAVTKLKSQIADTDFLHIYGQQALIKSAVRDATSDLKAILIYSAGDL